MKILITGSSGYIGNELVKSLKENEIHCLDILEPNDEIKSIATKIFINDIATTHIEDYYDIVIHCAALVPITRSTKEQFFVTNSLGTLNMLNLHYNKFIYISSSAIYGSHNGKIIEETKHNFIEPYGLSKSIAESFCYLYRKKMKDIYIIRPRTVLGCQRIGIMDILFKRISKSKTMYMLGNGDNLFQLIHVKDLIDFLKLIIKNNYPYKDYNIGTDRFSTLQNDLTHLIQESNSKSILIPLPIILKNVLKIADKLNLSPMTSWHYETIFNDFYFDITRAKSIGWKPKYSNLEMLLESFTMYKRLEDNKSSPHKTKLKKNILDLIP